VNKKLKKVVGQLVGPSCGRMDWSFWPTF